MNQQITKLVTKLNELNESRTPIELVELEIQGSLNMSLLGSPLVNGVSAIDPLLTDKFEAYSDNVMLFSYTPNRVTSGGSSTGSGLKALNPGQHLDAIPDGPLEPAVFKNDAAPIGDAVVRWPSEADPTHLKYYQESPAPYHAFSSEASYWGNTNGFDGDFPWGDRIVFPGGKAWGSTDRIKGEYPEAEAWLAERYDCELRFGYYVSSGYLQRNWSSDALTLRKKPTSPLRPIAGYHCHTISIKMLGGQTNPDNGLGIWAFYVKGAGPDTFEAYYAGAVPRMADTNRYAYAKPLYTSGTTAPLKAVPLSGLNVDGTSDDGDQPLALVLRMFGSHPTLDLGFQHGSVINAGVEDAELDGRTIKIRKFVARPLLISGSITKSWYENYHATGLGIWEPRPEEVRLANMETWGKVTDVNFRFEEVNCSGNSVKDLPAYAQYGRQRQKACKTNDFLTRPYDEYSTWGEIDQELSRVKAVSLWLSRNWGGNIIYNDASPRATAGVELTKFGDGSVSGIAITIGTETKSFAISESQKEAAIDFLGLNKPDNVGYWNQYLSTGDNDQAAAIAEFDAAYSSDLSARSLGAMDLISRSRLINTSKPYVNDKSEQSILYLIHQFGEFSSLRAGLPKLLSSFSYTSLVKAM